MFWNDLWWIGLAVLAIYSGICAWAYWRINKVILVGALLLTMAGPALADTTAGGLGGGVGGNRGGSDDVHDGGNVSGGAPGGGNR